MSLLKILVLFKMIDAVKQPLTRRAIGFEEKVNGQKLVDQVISTHPKTSEFACAGLCMLNSACRSYNYCESKLCELNQSLKSTYKAVMEQSPWCTYHGMSPDEVPKCQHFGVEKSVQDDDGFSYCAINGRRRDTKWSPWEEIIDINTDKEWKRHLRSYCFEPRHGGKDGECSGEREEILEWYRLAFPERSLEEARTNCLSMNGELISNFDGTKTQLDFLYDKFTEMSLWVGVYYEVESSSCRKAENASSDAVPCESLFLGDNFEASLSPDDVGSHLFLSFNGTREYLMPGVTSWKMNSICDLA